jgi:hypothetical protein
MCRLHRCQLLLQLLQPLPATLYLLSSLIYRHICRTTSSSSGHSIYSSSSTSTLHQVLKKCPLSRQLTQSFLQQLLLLLLLLFRLMFSLSSSCS